jgi:phosphoserine aminotransferase
MSSLAEEFPREQARVRELLGVYKAIGPAGVFGATMIEQALQRADRAAAAGDVIAMLRSLEELRGCQ